MRDQVTGVEPTQPLALTPTQSLTPTRTQNGLMFDTNGPETRLRRFRIERENLTTILSAGHDSVVQTTPGQLRRQKKKNAVRDMCYHYQIVERILGIFSNRVCIMSLSMETHIF